MHYVFNSNGNLYKMVVFNEQNIAIAIFLAILGVIIKWGKIQNGQVRASNSHT